MNREELKRRLQADEDRYEAEYRGRELPITLGGATRSPTLAMAAAAVAGTLTTLALLAVTGAAVSGLFSSSNTDQSPEGADRPCRSADFTVRSEPWPDAPMAGGVVVVLQANDGAWCHIEHGIYAAVSDANGDSAVEVAVGFREPIAVAPGQAWQSGVYWSTYCGSAGGTVAAPEHPVRPLQLSVGIAIDGEPIGGEATITGDTPLPVATDAEIAPEPCENEQLGGPFWLGLTGLAPYPGPAPSVSES